MSEKQHMVNYRKGRFRSNQRGSHGKSVHLTKETLQDQGKPEVIASAVYLIWASLGLAALIALVDKVTGNASASHFMFSLIIYGFVCILPYKISQRSNAARYFLAVTTVIGILLILGGVDSEITKLEKFSSLITTAMQAFAVYKLFSEPANVWFKKT